MINRITAIASAPLVMLGCCSGPPSTDIGDPPVPPASATKPPCKGTEIWLDNHNSETDCDVSPPQVINIRHSDPLTCDHSGGRWFLTLNGVTVCFDVDY